MATFNLQLLRNATVFNSKSSALNTLKTKLNASADGTPIIASYQETVDTTVTTGILLGVKNNGFIQIFDQVANEDGIKSLGESLDALTTRVTTLEGKVDVDKVSTAISTAINALDGTTTGNGSLVTSVTQTDGKVTTTMGSLSSTNKTITINGLDVDVNIDGNTIKKSDDGVLSVDAAALSVTGSEAIKSENGTISLVINSSDKVLTQSTDGLLTNISLAYGKYESDDIKYDNAIKLVGKNNTVITAIDAADFIKDGMINSVEYDSTNKKITIKWNTDAGKTTDTVLDVSDLVDTYTNGNGINITNNVVSAVKATSSESFLTIDANGIAVTGVQNAIDTAAAKATTVLTEHSDTSITTGVVVTKTTETDGHAVYNVTGKDIASASAVGLSADGTHIKTTGNYTSSATTIAGEIAALDTQVKANADAITSLTKTGKTAITEDATGHVTVSKATGADGNDVYTIGENDIASATDLTQEITDRGAQDDKIEASVGLAADGSYIKTTTANYTNNATTVVGAITALDTQIKANADAITKNKVVAGNGITVDTTGTNTSVAVKLEADRTADNTVNALELGTNGLYLANMIDCGTY